jgi:hypothetical protein
MSILQVYEMTYCPLLLEKDDLDSRRQKHDEGLWDAAKWLLLNNWKLPIELCYIADRLRQSIRTFVLIHIPPDSTPTTGQKDNYIDTFERILPDDYGWQYPLDKCNKKLSGELQGRAEFLEQITKSETWYCSTIKREFELFDIAAKLWMPGILNNDNRDEIVSSPVLESPLSPTRDSKKQLPRPGMPAFKTQLMIYPVCLPYHPPIECVTKDLGGFFREMLYSSPSVVSITLSPLQKMNTGIVHGLATFARRILEPYHDLMNLNDSIPFSEVERFYSGYLHAQSRLFRFQIDVLSTAISTTSSLTHAFMAQFGGTRVFQVTAPVLGIESVVSRRKTIDTLSDLSIDCKKKNYRTVQQWSKLFKSSPRIVNLDEAACLLRLPIGTEQGLAGIDVRQPPPFATSTTSLTMKNGNKNGFIQLGQIKTSKVIDRTKQQDELYHTIPIKQLCKHALIVGSTGSGKTTTVQYLLKQIADANIPFLVIEPSMKAEYYDSLKDQFGIPNITRLILGENFYFDPLRLPDNITVQQHVSYLKSCFESAFSFTDLGISIIETGLYRYYRKIYGTKTYEVLGSAETIGIEVLKDDNGKDTQFVFPSFNHFTLFFVHEFLPDLFPYLKDSTSQSLPSADDVAESFKRQFIALQEGPLGRLFQMADNKALSDLKKYGRMFPLYLPLSAVLELNRLPDRQHQALLMAFMMTLLFEQRQNEGVVKNNDGSPKHVLVIEEAHRLLGTDESGRNNEIAGESPRSKAAGMFSDMLAEIRAFGQSVMVAEQIPCKIIPDAVKNTNLKYLMRLTSAEDREFMGRSMNCTEQQQRFVNTLKTRQAVVFEEGLDQPILLEIPDIFNKKEKN